MYCPDVVSNKSPMRLAICSSRCVCRSAGWQSGSAASRFHLTQTQSPYRRRVARVSAAQQSDVLQRRSVSYFSGDKHCGREGVL